MAGIKETKEALIAGNEIGVLITKRFKDGAQFADFQAFYDAFILDAEFKAKIQAGYENVAAIPVEVGDLDISEIVELGMVQIAYVPKYVEALKA